MKIRPVYFVIAFVVSIGCVLIECMSVPVYQKRVCLEQINDSVAGKVESSQPESSPFGGREWVIRIAGAKDSWVWKTGLNVYRARTIHAGDQIRKRAGDAKVIIDSSVVRDLFECSPQSP